VSDAMAKEKKILDCRLRAMMKREKGWRVGASSQKHRNA